MAETKAPWCPVTATVEVIGGRWKSTILYHLKDRPVASTSCAAWYLASRSAC